MNSPAIDLRLLQLCIELELDLADQSTAGLILILAEAGCTLAECRAYLSTLDTLETS